MTRAPFPSLVDVDWLWRHLDEPGVRVLDASWHLPNSGRDAAAEFRAGHIPGAAFFDLDRIADHDSALPHMLPGAGQFGASVGRLGIDNASTVVVYDSLGLFSAARAWWMFRVFGHDRVAVLDGGMPAWRAAGLPLERGVGASHPALFEASFDAGRVVSFHDVRANVEHPHATLVDARSADRFTGDAPEPRPGLPSGHIPGSWNVPFDRVADPQTKRVRSADCLEGLFPWLDERPVICSCGTGVTACVLALALHRMGREDVSVYDGSWTEWAARDDAPVETGPRGAAPKE